MGVFHCGSFLGIAPGGPGRGYCQAKCSSSALSSHVDAELVVKQCFSFPVPTGVLQCVQPADNSLLCTRAGAVLKGPADLGLPSSIGCEGIIGCLCSEEALALFLRWMSQACGLSPRSFLADKGASHLLHDLTGQSRSSTVSWSVMICWNSQLASSSSTGGMISAWYTSRSYHPTVCVNVVLLEFLHCLA